MNELIRNLMASILVMTGGITLGAPFIDITVQQTESATLDFPVGRCGGHAQSGVQWIAPQADTINISGAVWKFRQSDAAFVSLWLKGAQRVRRVEVVAGVKATRPSASTTLSRSVISRKWIIVGKVGSIGSRCRPARR